MGEVICDHAKNCTVGRCRHKKPHLPTIVISFGAGTMRCTKGGYDDCGNVKCVPVKQHKKTEEIGYPRTHLPLYMRASKNKNGGEK